MESPYNNPATVRKLPIAAAWLFAAAAVNGAVAWAMLGERGVENRKIIREYLSD